jgi:hydrogenase nickel incorporation protein HypA/HybF
MHEFSIAQSLVESVLSEARKNNAKKVLVIDISIAELMQLDKDIFLDLVSSFLTGPVLGSARLEVKTEKAVFSCRKCGRSWDMSEAKKQLQEIEKGLLIKESDGADPPLHFLPQLYPAFIHCPDCGSSNILLQDSGSVQITRLVLE